MVGGHGHMGCPLLEQHQARPHHSARGAATRILVARRVVVPEQLVGAINKVDLHAFPLLRDLRARN